MARARDQRLSLFHIDKDPFIFHASPQRLEFGDTLLLGVRDEHQVISVEKSLQHTSEKLMLKRLQGEEEWAKDRALMHTNSSQYWPLTS